jgi:hypothetical protein
MEKVYVCIYTLEVRAMPDPKQRGKTEEREENVILYTLE